MLVLTRKLNESIVIGDHIRIKVVEVSGSQIRLGIEAPPDVKIYREEVIAKALEQNQQASIWTVDDYRRMTDLYLEQVERA